MRRFLILIIAAALFVVPFRGFGQALPKDEQDFLDKHMSELIRITTTKISDPALTKVFAATFYKLKVTIKQGDGDMSSDTIAARVGDKLVSVDRPGTDMELPDWVKMFNPSFKLQKDGDAKTFQQALDLAYPIMGDEDKKVAKFVHQGTTWTFIRGAFFDKKLGFVIQTDATGTIKSAAFSLKIP